MGLRERGVEVIGLGSYGTYETPGKTPGARKALVFEKVIGHPEHQMKEAEKRVSRQATGDIPGKGRGKTLHGEKKARKNRVFR